MRWQFWKRGATPPAEPIAVPAPVVKRGIGRERLLEAGSPKAAPEPVDVFKPYTPPNLFGRAPAKIATMAMDDASQFQAVMAWGTFGDAYAEGLTFAGYPQLANWSQRPEYRRPSEIIAKEMTRKWLRIQASGEEDKSDKVAEIVAEFDRLQVRDKFREALELDGLFGRAHIVPDFGLQLGDEEFRSPLALSAAKIKKGSLKALRVVEPLWTYPGSYNTTNPLAEDFYKPQSWLVMSQEVHASRMLTIISREVPDMLKPAYSFGGLPLSQLMKPYVDNWLSTRQGVNDLINSFTTWVLKTNMSSLTNPTPAPGEADLIGRLQGFTQAATNRGVFAIDKDTEDFDQVSAQLGTLDKLQAQAQEHMAAASGIPLIKLFGITPTGLGVTSEGEIAVFHEWLEAQQRDLDPHVKRLLALVQLNLYGEVDDAITHAWEPMRHLDELQLATVRKTEAETDVLLCDGGILDPLESRKRLAADEDSPYAGIDVDDLPEPPEPQADPNASPDEPNPAAEPNPTQDDPT